VPEKEKEFIDNLDILRNTWRGQRYKKDDSAMNNLKDAYLNSIN